MAHDRVGEVGPADRLALGPPARELGVVELVAELAQRRTHRLGAVLAILAPGVQALAQPRIEVVDQVPEHVEVLLVQIDGRDLDRRDHANALVGPRRERFAHAVDRVVVAQREQLDARLARGRDHRARLERPVRVERVALKIEGGRFDAQAPRG